MQADRKPKSGRSLQERLSELEMGGLIELTDEHAKFVVLGSTGRHYTVTLSSGKASCECVDFRIRKRTCKHQQLIYDQLGEAPGSDNWHEVTTRWGSPLRGPLSLRVCQPRLGRQ